MQKGDKARLLSIYLDERDLWHSRPLYLVLLEKFRELGLRGATVLRGVFFYWWNCEIYTSHLLDLGANLPLLIQVVDTNARIDRALGVLADLMPDGLATLGEVEVANFRPRT